MTNKEDKATSALVVGLVLLLLSSWNLYRDHRMTAGILGGIGITLLLVWLIAPGLSRRFHNAWMALAAALGYVNSRILLSLLYFLVLSVYGGIMRLAGRNRLGRRWLSLDSYWIKRPVTRQTTAQFERLF